MVNGMVISATEPDTQTEFCLSRLRKWSPACSIPPRLAASVSGLGVCVVNSDVKICSERHIPTNCAPIRAWIISRDHLQQPRSIVRTEPISSLTETQQKPELSPWVARAHQTWESLSKRMTWHRDKQVEGHRTITITHPLEYPPSVIFFLIPFLSESQDFWRSNRLCIKQSFSIEAIELRKNQGSIEPN